MNAHNEQHDPASPVVKQNLTTQPAAAQEADGARARLHEIAYRDTAVSVTVRADDLRALLAEQDEVGHLRWLLRKARSVALLCDPAVRWRQPPAANSLEAMAYSLIHEIDAAIPAGPVDAGPAAQKAVAKVGSDHFRSIVDWLGPIPPPNTLLYASPVTAAPASYTYASEQATTCAGCGEHKHTPLRIDAMGGYVCLTCIDQKLGSLLGEFGYTPAAPGIDHAILARDIHHAIADAGLAPLSPADNHTLREVIRSVIDASHKGGSEAVEPDTFFIMGCPGYPGGYSVYPNTMQNALKFIAEHGNEHTTLATWCRQYQRRDYTAQEVRALLASDAEVRL